MEEVLEAFTAGDATEIAAGGYGGTHYAFTLSTPGTWAVSGSATLTRRARAVIGITPDLGLSQTVGWIHLDSLLQLQTRLRWSCLPGSDLFLVYQLDLGLDPLTEDHQPLLLEATLRWPWD